MGILGNIRQCERLHRHGGCVVLRILWDAPMGDTVAARHFADLTELLCDHAERELLPATAEALTQAVAKGEGFRFSPHRYRMALTTSPAGRGVHITLSVTLTAGDEILSHRTLESFWSKTGEFQFRSSDALGKKRKMPRKKQKGTERGEKATKVV